MTGQDATTEPSRWAAEGRYSLLVVDDDESLCASLARLLQGERYEVRAETDARRALDLARSHSVDVILLDNFMPDLDGAGFVEALRSEGLRDRVKVVLMTVDHVAPELARQLACDAWVGKPLDPEELEMIVGRVLRGERTS